MIPKTIVIATSTAGNEKRIIGAARQIMKKLQSLSVAVIGGPLVIV